MGTQITTREQFRPAPVERIALILGRMFLTLLSPHGGKIGDAMAAEYVDAIKTEPEWAIAQACEDYRHGKRGDGKFVPFPGEFGKAVREIRAAKAKDVARTEAERREIQARREWLERRNNPDKASQERVKALAEKVRQSIAEKVLESDEVEARKHREAMEIAKVHDRFDSASRFGAKWDLPMSEDEYRAKLAALPDAEEYDRQMRARIEARRGRGPA